jgi:putative FmdB family regulatory protein
MPTYDYQCKNCGHHFEEFQSVTEDPLTICPQCSGSLQRLITGGSGLIFKGSGFYITDYKNGKNRSKSSSSSGSSSKETPKKTTKTNSNAD